MRFFHHDESASLVAVRPGGDLWATNIDGIAEIEHLRFLDLWSRGCSIDEFPVNYQLSFDEAAHRYTLDGAPVPSVTPLIEKAHDFRHVKEEDLERARDYGTKVHKTIELAEAGRLDESSLHPALANPLAGWRRWKKDFRFRPFTLERRVASRRYSYAGTIDVLGVLYDENDVAECALLADVKTGSPYLAHRAQTAGYLCAAEEIGLLPAGKNKRGCLYLNANDDSYDWHWHSNPLDAAAFHSLRTLYHWEQHHGKR